MIDECLPLPGVQKTEWKLWAELWLRAARDPALQPMAARMYMTYRDWMETVIRFGVSQGEFTCEDVTASADIAMGLLDGLGVRALIEDPEMDVERVRLLAAERISSELGIQPGTLTA